MHTTGSRLWQRHRLPVLGVGYLVVLALLVWVCVAAFTKDLPWQRVVSVEVVTTHAGLELNNHADVKIAGRVVGEVRGVRSSAGRTVIELGLDPDEVRHVPADVDAAIVPKTLFGEKFVDLLPRAAAPGAGGAGDAGGSIEAAAVGATGPRITDGAVIEQTATATEIGDVYAKLVPVLRAIDPAKLSTVLTTLASTVQGRGAQLNQTVRNLGELLERVDPHLDTLDADLRQLARVLEGYDAAAPDVLRTLANATALSTDLLVPAEERLGRFLDTLTDLSDTTREVLAANGENLVHIVTRGEPLLALLDEYSPMLACSIDGLRLVDLHGNLTTGSRGPYVLLSIDMFLLREPYSAPRDLPTERTSGAHLDSLPAPIRSWAPHCPRFGEQIHRAVDAQPRSLPPMPHQVISNEREQAGAQSGTKAGTGSGKKGAGTKAGTAAGPLDLEAQRLALATALARDLLARTGGTKPGTGEAGTASGSGTTPGSAELGGLLLAPLLGDDPVEVP
ncbi:MCE family protein [Nocardioides sp. zg-ZUI104]|uniref:MCE family protein n=1 Tax=Nocardioides faecalis TaxID=2803858 RepID=UPI001BCB414A|nr:MCE family protein [Nocardioides faecalis]MBS4752212.1 MCE family protein [Nocardioides faecalis]